MESINYAPLSDEELQKKAIEIFPLLDGLNSNEVDKTLKIVKDIMTGFPINIPSSVKTEVKAGS